MANLSKSKLDAMSAASKPVVVWDRGRLPGFGVKIMPTGKKVFILDTRIDGKSRRITLGRYGPLTLDAARKLAADRLFDVVQGKDPTAEKRTARSTPTVSELCDLYVEAADAGLVVTRFGRAKKPSTVAIDRGMIKRHIKPLIGNIRSDKLTRAEVQRMIDAIAVGKTAMDTKTVPRGRSRVTGGKGIATRTAELLGGIWSWGAKRGLVSGASPSSGTDRFRSQPADRRLSSEELGRLGRAIREAEAKWQRFETARNATHKAGARGPMLPKGLVTTAGTALCRLIATTGMRPGEAAGLRWAEIDTTAQTISLDDTKTGRSRRPLGRAAIEVLQSIDVLSAEWVFPASRGNGSATMKKPLVLLFKLAGIDATPKVLRSTFASVAADLGFSGGTIGEMLGHARQGVTERHYIRRIDSVLTAAADQVSLEILRLMGLGPPSRPVGYIKSPTAL